MTDQALSLLINPTAGRGRAGRQLDRIKQVFESRGIALQVFASRGVGDLEAQVGERLAAGERRIVVVGGDGSVHEAVNGIFRRDTECAMGLVPCGTGNDFAKACGLTLDCEAAAVALAERIAAHQAVRKIDIGRMNERYFANGLGIGFDAKVTRIARSFSFRIGDAVYLLAILRCLVDGIDTPAIVIDNDAFHFRGPATLAAVCNGAWVGGMFHIAPMANNADGKLELLIAAPVSRLRLLSLIPRLMRGKHVYEPELTHYRVTETVITSKNPLESHLDGEVQALQSEFRVELLPGALNLL